MNEIPEDQRQRPEPTDVGPQMRDRIPDTPAGRVAAFATDLLAVLVFCFMLVVIWAPFQISCLFDRVRHGRKRDD